jgi:hypothetical protein
MNRNDFTLGSPDTLAWLEDAVGARSTIRVDAVDELLLEVRRSFDG